mgnify:CR=1 FL=1
MIQIFKPNRDNLNTSLSIGLPLIVFAFIDFFGNTFLNVNLTKFLPVTLSYFFPLLAGTIGLYFIRIEFSGVRILDTFNKNVNSTTFNAVLTLLIIFVLFKYTPPLLDWLLFDAKVKSGEQPGGTGHSFDWTILQSYKGHLPWMLAGGLDQTSVVNAIRISGAKAVDVSSGVELNAGKKDVRQIHDFIRATQLV